MSRRTRSRILPLLAFLASLLGYFISWPYGRQIGVLAAPAGLAIIALRSPNMASAIQQNPAIAQQQAIFAAIRWEPIYWLIVISAGLLGVFAAQKFFPSIAKTPDIPSKTHSESNKWINAAISLAGSALIAFFCIGIFAQDVRALDSRLGSIVAQPSRAQIALALILSFAIAAFVAKKFFDADYIWPIAATLLITLFATSAYTSPDILQHLSTHQPAVFFSNVIAGILPVQMVAFGSLGSIAGYWLAVRYNCWRLMGSQA